MASVTHWFEALADHMGSAYLRYSFTRRTVAEVDVLLDALELSPGMSALDVGCGPGRHTLELASRGVKATGVDVSQRFVGVAEQAARTSGLAEAASFVVADARSLPFDGRFDAAFGMCQGAFGLQGGPAAGDDLGNLDADLEILDGMRRAVRPGGRVALAAFSAYFQVRHLEVVDLDPTAGSGGGGDARESGAISGTGGTFDPVTAVHHERTTIRSETGEAVDTDLWTTCVTPRELVLMARTVGLEPLDVHSVASGERFDRGPVVLDEPEVFLICRRPG